MLEGIEFGEEQVEAAEELTRCRGIKVANCGEGEAEEEVVCGFAGEFSMVKVGHSMEVGLIKEIGIEPIDAAFVTTFDNCQHSTQRQLQIG